MCKKSAMCAYCNVACHLFDKADHWVVLPAAEGARFSVWAATQRPLVPWVGSIRADYAVCPSAHPKLHPDRGCPMIVICIQWQRQQKHCQTA